MFLLNEFWKIECQVSYFCCSYRFVNTCKISVQRFHCICFSNFSLCQASTVMTISTYNHLQNCNTTRCWSVNAGQGADSRMRDRYVVLKTTHRFAKIWIRPNRAVCEYNSLSLQTSWTASSKATDRLCHWKGVLAKWPSFFSPMVKCIANERADCHISKVKVDWPFTCADSCSTKITFGSIIYGYPCLTAWSFLAFLYLSYQTLLRELLIFASAPATSGRP